MAIDEHQGLHPDTLAVVAGRPPREPGAALNVPIHLTSTYHAGGEVGYARDGNASWTAFEDAVGVLEGGQALSFASGLGAVAAVLDQLPAGAVVVAPRDAYTGTRAALGDEVERGRLQVRLVDVTDTAATVAACEGAAMVWLESPTNPMLTVPDIAATAQGAHQAGCTVVVDNTFATPLLQQPLSLGADVVVHSATKFIAGHHDVLMGIVVVRDDDRHAAVARSRSLRGAIPGPVEAFLALRGLRTLPLRLARAQASAGVLAQRLAEHAAVSFVRYPGLPTDPHHDRAAKQMSGFGAVLAFEAGDAEFAERVCESTRVIAHTTSLGGIETTMERRRRHPLEDFTPESLIRLSVGCEHVEDLWTDLDRALERA